MADLDNFTDPNESSDFRRPDPSTARKDNSALPLPPANRTDLSPIEQALETLRESMDRVAEALEEDLSANKESSDSTGTSNADKDRANLEREKFEKNFNQRLSQIQGTISDFAGVLPSAILRPLANFDSLVTKTFGSLQGVLDAPLKIWEGITTSRPDTSTDGIGEPPQPEGVLAPSAEPLLTPTLESTDDTPKIGDSDPYSLFFTQPVRSPLGRFFMRMFGSIVPDEGDGSTNSSLVKGKGLIGSAVGGLLSSLGGLLGLLSAPLSAITGALAGIGAKISGFLTAGAAKLGILFAQFLGWFDIFDSFFNGGGLAAFMSGDIIGGIGITFGLRMKETIDSIWDAIVLALQNATRGAALGGLLGSLIPGIGNVMGAVIGAVTYGVTSLVDSFFKSEKGGELKEFFLEKVMGFFAPIGTWIGDLISDWGERIRSFGANLNPFTDMEFDFDFSLPSLDFSDLGSRILNWITSQWENLTSRISGGFNSFIKSISDFWTNFTSIFSYIGKDGIGWETVGNFRDAISNAPSFQAFQALAREAPTTEADAISIASEALRNAGETSEKVIEKEATIITKNYLPMTTTMNSM